MVYYANYFVWFEVGRVNFLREIGLRYDELEREGIGFVIAEASCRYRAPAHFDERLIVRTWIKGIRRRSFTVAYEVVNLETGMTLATGHTVQVFVRMDGENRGVVEIPEKVRVLLEQARGSEP